jgi:hypothetical protein
MTSERANQPRWNGRPGFFEIWFLVVFDPSARRAWWLRYTTFAPAPEQASAARATLWAAAFSLDTPPVVAKGIFPATAYFADQERFGVHIGPAVLTNGTCRGEVRSNGHAITWDLRFAPAEHAAEHGPWLLRHLPLPTRVAHANSDISCQGWVSVDGRRVALDGARATQKHIWGTRRVEELFWLYCPQFAGEPGARFEATSVRLRRRRLLPRLAPIRLRSRERTFDWSGLVSVFRNRVVPAGLGRVEVRAVSATRALVGSAWCEPRSLVGYVYRDPAGWDVYVAQSDVASCALERFERPHPLAAWRPAGRLTAEHCAALEFHAPEPLPGVSYLAWDAVSSR